VQLLDLNNSSKSTLPESIKCTVQNKPRGFSPN